MRTFKIRSQKSVEKTEDLGVGCSEGSKRESKATSWEEVVQAIGTGIGLNGLHQQESQKPPQRGGSGGDGHKDGLW